MTTNLPPIIFEDLTVGDLIAVISTYRGTSICNEWFKYLHFGKDLRGVWDALSDDDYSSFVDSLHIEELKETNPDPIKERVFPEIKKFFRKSKHDDVLEALSDHIDEDWFVDDIEEDLKKTEESDDERFARFSSAIFDVVKGALEVVGMRLTHRV